MSLRLVIFDVDGTLVDSQADIVMAMNAAFGALALTPPSREAILSIVGLSLDQAMAALAPDLDAGQRGALVDQYKASYVRQRQVAGTQASSPLYPGMRAVLERLHAVPETLLGVATGKSQRGLDILMEGHQMRHLFVTLQCADHHPSKPHPAMVQKAMAETGVAADQTVMIGDTSFDMDMARAAGVRALGVSWGYHDKARLIAAHRVVDRVDQVPEAIDMLWSQVA